MLYDLAKIFILSMVPVIELRGAIPLGFAYGLPMGLNFAVCVLGNILPVPILILFARKVLYFFAKLPKIGHLFQKIIDIGNSKIDRLGKYELLGLFLFVAIPAPGTGAWTGALIATLLQLKLSKAFVAISLGVITAGAIMVLLTYGVIGAII